ncbi:MAG: copper resistance system multicopper oxidase [Alphaproteobacteria bacterium]|nr:copper resistance system multicopper oxidase [Alphaproteobacteria bacterium]
MSGNPPLVRTVRTGGIGRRRFVQGIAAAGVIGLGGIVPRRGALAATVPQQLSGTEFDLTIHPLQVNMTGYPAMATGINGSVPAPILHWRQGDTVVLRVKNELRETSSIHWHGIRSPANMDGVPGLSFPGIAPGETFVYRIPIPQSGTYWYHSHSMYQEQTGVYGSIIIAPKAGYPQRFDRDYVVLLSDWTDTDPEVLVSNLKFQSDYYNFHQRTVGTFFSDVAKHGLGPTVDDRLMWGQMRMSPTDILDVSGATYTYLLNGAPPGANWTGLFRPGERVRLRFINGSAMSIFDVRIPGLTMSVVEADGNSVVPVDVDEFRISVAETYDVIVHPTEAKAYTIFVQAEDRTGYARGTLAPRPGMAGPIPPMDPRPIRTMTDMGMGNMNMGGDMAGMSSDAGSSSRAARNHAGAPTSPRGQPAMPMDHGGMAGMAGHPTASVRAPAHGPVTTGGGKAIGHAAAPKNDVGGGMPGMDMGSGSMPGMSMDHGNTAGMDMGKSGGGSMGGMDMKLSPVQRRMQGTVGVDNVAMMPTERLNQAGEPLNRSGRRVLTYADLRALQPGDDPRPPSREITLHLTGNMQRFVWGFDGKKFSEAEPIRLKLGERVRFTLINDSMMEHPIHLHGLWSELENGYGDHRPYKHTINVKPGEKLSYLVTADEPGHWAYHCHLLYHMEMGMFRTVIVA